MAFPSASTGNPHANRKRSRTSSTSTLPSTSGSRSQPIDLTDSPPRPPRRRTPPAPTTGRRYSIPPWQDDLEVAECPCCHVAFGLLFRRHHCRRCGRVVCDACSRHRITIPSQHVVRSPPRARSGVAGLPSVITTAPTSLSLSRAEEGRSGLETRQRADSSSGEKVRVCNPCVPDPNPHPPPSLPTNLSITDAPATSFRSIIAARGHATSAEDFFANRLSSNTSRSHPQTSHRYIPRPSQIPNRPTAAQSSNPSTPPRTPTSSFLANVYRFPASEKDCSRSLEEGGGPAECQICLEELEPGTRLVRLQCWCKVHESCIVMWWGKCAAHLRGKCPEHIGL